MNREQLTVGILVFLVAFSSATSDAQDVLRWNFSGQLFEVDDVAGVFPDLRVGDPITGFLRYDTSVPGTNFGCDDDGTASYHHTRLQTGISHFSSVQFTVENPRTEETYSSITPGATQTDVEILVNANEDGDGYVGVSDFDFKPLGDGLGESRATFFDYYGEPLESNALPTELSIWEFDEVVLTHLLISEDFFTFDFPLFSAALFSLEPTSVNMDELGRSGIMPPTMPARGVFELPELSSIRHLSGDGSTAVDSNWRWTEADSSQNLPVLAGFDSNLPYETSADGSVIVGRLATCDINERRAAYRWSEATGLDLLGHPDGFPRSQAYAVSGDGGVVAGRSFRTEGEDTVTVSWAWTEEGGFQMIPEFTSTPQAVSADGTWIVDTHGNVWSEQEAFSIGGVGDDDRPSARDISDDGSVIVGSGILPTDAIGGAFRWTKAGGIQPLGVLPGRESHDRSSVEAVSPDGKVAVGRSYSSDSEARDQRAIVWDETHGMRELETVLLEEYGIEKVHPFGLGAARGISDDRRVIVGLSDEDRDDFASDNATWMIRLDWPLASIRGDFDLDDMLTSDDVDTLAAAILRSDTDPNFDLVDDDILNVADLSNLLERSERLNGDANFDGEVNFPDFLIMADNFGDAFTWSGGDFDASGDVGFPDFLILSANFGMSSEAAMAQVPEPTFGPFMIVLAILIGRHGRSIDSVRKRAKRLG